MYHVGCQQAECIMWGVSRLNVCPRVCHHVGCQQAECVPEGVLSAVHICRHLTGKLITDPESPSPSSTRQLSNSFSKV